MKRALIVSKSEKAVSFFKGMLKEDMYEDVMLAATGATARQILSEQDFGLCIIDIPLKDEPGSDLAVKVSENAACQVIMTISSDFYDEVTHQMQEYGIMTVAKPINRSMFYSALKMTDAISVRMGRIQKEKEKLLQKIEDLRIVNRAKLTLITHLNMSENDAHKYIERQAMDMRRTRRQVAENILKTYQN
ncbi:MAG: ANTAR domain-containing protein [Eubacterium sp.]|nr:ANTAR domain-containing protein [Eubacterium sp.]